MTDDSATRIHGHGIRITETVVLAATPAAGYLLAFQYERGYCRAFSIPTDLIELDLVRVLIAVSAVLGAMLAWSLALNYVAPKLWSLRATAAGRAVFRLSIPVLFTVLMATVAGPSVLPPLLIVVAVVAFLEFVLPLRHREPAKYQEKLKKQEDIEQRDVTIVDVVGRRFGSVPVLCSVILLVGWFASGALGEAAARTNEKFLVPVGHENLVVLRHYGGTFIAATFDPAARIVSTHFIMMRPDDERCRNGVVLRVLGPLSTQ